MRAVDAIGPGALSGSSHAVTPGLPAAPTTGTSADPRTYVMTLPVAGANYRFVVLARNAVGRSPVSARSNLVVGR